MAESHSFKTLSLFLNWYYKNCQKQIVLVYRGDLEEDWSKRCLYLDKNYKPLIKYNHRSIMDCEVVFEYDTDNTALNALMADSVAKKLKKDRITYAKWSSGNKSTHVHCLFKIPSSVKNLSLLKNTIMKYYGTFYYHEPTGKISENRIELPEGEETKRIWPDLRLASKGHLIRAEFGVNEKTGYEKELLWKNSAYPSLSVVPPGIWEAYERAQKNSVSIRMGQQTKDLVDSNIVKMLIDTVQFKDNMDDGRERIMWPLIQILKNKYSNIQDMHDFIWEWYLYSSSQRPKMDEKEVLNKVRYHYSHDYTITHDYLVRLLEEISGKTYKEGKLI
jgi:hypothetical protein